MSRQRSLLLAQRQDALLRRVQTLKAEHPFWGDRRLWAYLRFVEQWPVHKTRGWRLMREPHLVGPTNLQRKAKGWRLMREPHLVGPTNLQRKAKRTPTGSKPRATKPHEWWGLDMTKRLGEGCGWGYLVVVLAWSTKKLVGYDAGMPCTAKHWLAALDMAVNHEFPTGARGRGVSLMSDHGCQPTSLALMPACQTRGVHQVCTSDNNPKGHADTERRMRTRQEECLWLQEWTRLFALIRALDVWITDDHAHDLHSSLGYQSPTPFERAYHLSHGTPFVAA